jgi:hypothetical protein
MGDDEGLDGDGPDDGKDTCGEVSTHARAAAMATVTEKQRATLARALVTLVKMTHARGFDVIEVAGEPVEPVEPGEVVEAGAAPRGFPFPDDPVMPWTEALRRASVGCDDPARMVSAERCKEVLVLGQVPEGGARTYTPCAAQNVRPGAQMAVVCIANGKVETVREVLDLLRKSLAAVVSVVLVSRCTLTSFTRKYIGALADPVVDFFPLETLQRCAIEHKLVPWHQALNAEQVARARDQYKDAIFSRMLTKDAIARFYGFVPGQMVFFYETWGRREPIANLVEVVASP